MRYIYVQLDRWKANYQTGHLAIHVHLKSVPAADSTLNKRGRWLKRFSQSTLRMCIEMCGIEVPLDLGSLGLLHLTFAPFQTQMTLLVLSLLMAIAATAPPHSPEPREEREVQIDLGDFLHNLIGGKFPLVEFNNKGEGSQTINIQLGGNGKEAGGDGGSEW